MDGAAAVHRAPRGVEGRDVDDAHDGGAGPAAVPVDVVGGATPMAPSESQSPGEVAADGGAPASSGGWRERPENSAGDASAAAGAPTVVALPRPSCGKQQEGTLCGANMTPPGAPDRRYFCFGGEVLAEARCPAACNVETNACELSGGTGSGSGETNLHTALRCPECYATICRAELVACQGSPRCVAHLSCVESCSSENACFTICEEAFGGEPLFGDLDKCAEQTGCAARCQVEGTP